MAQMDFTDLPHAKDGKVRPSVDRAGSEEAKERSGGRCEVVIAFVTRLGFTMPLHRCIRLATQVHHMIGGIGRRGVGRSALAEHKQHVCEQCHEDITGGVGGKKLIRVGGTVPMWNDCYRRA